MPRKGKRGRFRGISSQEKRKSAENSIDTAGTSTTSADDSTVNNADLGDLDIVDSNQVESLQPESMSESSQDAGCDTESTTKTASERKLGHSLADSELERGEYRNLAYSKAGSRTGYRLIDLECLNDALKVAHKCKGGEYNTLIKIIPYF